MYIICMMFNLSGLVELFLQCLLTASNKIIFPTTANSDVLKHAIQPSLGHCLNSSAFFDNGVNQTCHPHSTKITRDIIDYMYI